MTKKPKNRKVGIGKQKREIAINRRYCPNNNRCPYIKCPFDPDIKNKAGKRYERCRWIMERRDKNIRGREFISGGRPMPYALLEHVPENNIKLLNKASRKRWSQYLRSGRRPLCE